MAASTINTITLSGGVTNNRYVAAPGDVYLYRNDDRQGGKLPSWASYKLRLFRLLSGLSFDGQKWAKTNGTGTIKFIALAAGPMQGGMLFYITMVFVLVLLSVNPPRHITTL